MFMMHVLFRGYLALSYIFHHNLKHINITVLSVQQFTSLSQKIYRLPGLYFKKSRLSV